MERHEVPLDPIIRAASRGPRLGQRLSRVGCHVGAHPLHCARQALPAIFKALQEFAVRSRVGSERRVLEASRFAVVQALFEELFHGRSRG